MYPHYMDYVPDLDVFFDDEKTFVQRVENPAGNGHFITRGDAYVVAWDDGRVEIGGVNL